MANSVDPDEAAHYEPPHLDLYCLQVQLFSVLVCKSTIFSFVALSAKLSPITTAADDVHKYFILVFSEKIRLDISCESSARQRIHIKHQGLF